MSSEDRLLLASASPRRRELLQQLGYEPDILPVDIDEAIQSSEDPFIYVERMAREKLEAAHEAAIEKELEACFILTGDTIGVAAGETLVKPANYQDFERMMRLLSGKKHTIASSFALGFHESNKLKLLHLEVVKTDVYFKEMDDREIRAYWETGEPKDKACGYGIQGLGAAFVRKIEGSYSNVVGLPLMEVHQALRNEGIKSRL